MNSMRDASKAEMKPSVATRKASERIETRTGEWVHPRKTSLTDSQLVSIYDMVSDFDGDDEAQNIIRMLGYRPDDVKPKTLKNHEAPKGTDPNFTRSDFESALRKVSRKLPQARR